MKSIPEYIVQITAGRGPEECWRVVARATEVFLKEARAKGLTAEVVDSTPGNLPGTLLSALIKLKGLGAEVFLAQWEGTVQWISPSPFRKLHKRKNWFVGVQVFDVTQAFQWNEKEVTYDTLRASGPGGQHVNKTESAVRATHVPSGVAVVASDQRSQHQNKALAKERLQEKLQLWHLQQAMQQTKNQWEQHNALERGNAVRTFQERL